MSDENTLAHHRYSWTKLEIGTLGFFSLAIITVTTLFFTGVTDFAGTYFIIVGFCLLSSIFLFYIGKSKKKASELTAILKNGVLEVKGGKLEQGNKVALKNVKTIKWRDDELWIILAPDNDDAPLKIPARLANDPALRAHLRSLETNGVKMQDKVKEVLEIYDNKKI